MPPFVTPGDGGPAASHPTASLAEYEVRHLVEHLHAADSGGDIHRLLRLEDAPEVANSWFAAQERIHNVDGYVRDLRLALELTGPESVALEARYALMTSSARSVASSVPAALLGASVKAGVRTVDEALAQLERTTDPALIADTLVLLAPHVPAERHAELRVLAGVLGDMRARAVAFAGLAGSLAEAELPALLGDLERGAPELVDGEILSALTTLAPRLGEAHAPRLLALARGIERGVLRAEALVALGRGDEALDAVRSDPRHFRWSDVLAQVLAALPEDQRERVRGPVVREATANLEYAGNAPHLVRELSLRGDEIMPVLRRAIELHPWEDGPKALLALAPTVPDARLGELLELTRDGTGADARAGIGSAIAAAHDRTVARLLAAVAQRLPDALHELALEIVAELDASPDRCVALAALGEPERAAAEATALRDPAERATALFGLGDATLDAALQAARQVSRPADRAELLLAAGRSQLVPQAVAAAREAEEPWRRVELLLAAIPAADDREPLVREALGLLAERATEQFNPYPSAQLAELAPHLPSALAREAAAAALLIDANGWGDLPQAAIELTPHLPEDALRALIDDCGRLPADKRAQLLKSIADCVPPTLHANVLAQVAQLDGEDILTVVAEYAERLSPPLILEALRVCRRIGDAPAAVATAADLVVAAGIRPVPKLVLDAALATDGLDRLAPLLSPDQRERALDAAGATALGALAGMMPPERLAELLERVGDDEEAIARVIHGGAARFPPELVDEVADRAAALVDDVDRFNAVAALAPRLTPETRLRLGRATGDVDLLLALIDEADEITGQELLDAAVEAIEQLDSDAATAMAYLEISRLLEGEDRAGAVEAALSWAYVIELAEQREPVLEEALGELAKLDPARALGESGALPEEGQHRLLLRLIAGLDEEGQLDVVQRVEAVAHESTRADLLAQLLQTEGLAEPSSARLRQAAQRLEEPAGRVKTLAALLANRPHEAEGELRALAATRDLPAPSRELALESLLARGPDDVRAAAFTSLLAARRASSSSRPLDIVVAFDAAADPARLWARLMRVLADHPRPTILGALSALADVAAQQGEEPTAQIVEAVGESVRWWP